MVDVQSIQNPSTQLPNVRQTGVNDASTIDTGVSEAVREIDAAVDEMSIDEAAVLVNEALESFAVEGRIVRDESTDSQVVSLVDQSSGDVIMQLPNAQLLHAAKNIQSLKGLLLDKTA